MTLTIIVTRTENTTQYRSMDYAAHIDGKEEEGSAFGSTAREAIHALIDSFSDEEMNQV